MESDETIYPLYEKLVKRGQEILSRVPDLFIVDALDKLSASKLKGTSDFILTADMLGLE